jgi:nicotinamide riboside kinase
MNENNFILAFTGPECSGKTTLSHFFSSSIRAVLVPEYARLFLENLDRTYVQSDLDQICVNQFNQLDSLVKSHPLSPIVLDTEALVLKIWSEVRFGSASTMILNYWDSQKVDHYFLCNPNGIEWEFDPLRENPENRHELFALYYESLLESGRSFSVLSGTLNERKLQLQHWLDAWDKKSIIGTAFK